MQTRKQKIEELRETVNRLAFENRKLIRSVVSKNMELIELDDKLNAKTVQIERYAKMIVEMHDKIDDLEKEIKVCRDIMDRLGDRNETK